MWALNLLRFTEAQDAVQASNSNGLLYVYHGRMTRKQGEPIESVHTIDPGNVRFVDDWNSFKVKVGASGWLFNDHALWHSRLDSDSFTREHLEEILAKAEAGKKPPFFDDKTQYVKVEPGLAGREVQVIKFDNYDFVVVDVEARKLVGRRTERLLSKERREETPQIKA